jgi:hypothetical protein
MAASSNVATPIKVWKILNTGSANPDMKRMQEKSAQTFLLGTPVQVDVAGATGFVIGCPTMSSVATAIVAGFSAEPGANLTTSGVAKTLTYGSVQNQPSAVLIPIGAPPNDGTTGFYVAADETIFIGVLGNGATAANATVAQADVGKIYGLTKDGGNNYWYIDNNITTLAGGAVCTIFELVDPVGTLNGREAFKIQHAAQQLQQ